MSNPTESEQMIVLRIRRQDRPDPLPRWEEFAVPRRPNMNIISCLQYIAAQPDHDRRESRPRRLSTTAGVWRKSAAPAPC